MGRDTILKDDADVSYSYSNLKTQGWLEGQPCGLDAAASFLQERAVDLFRQKKDSEAMSLRSLAEEMVKKLKPDMQKRAELHAKECPIILDRN